MKIIGTLVQDPDTYMDRRRIGDFQVGIKLQHLQHKYFMLGGKVADYVFKHFQKGDRIILFISKNDVIYKAGKK